MSKKENTGNSGQEISKGPSADAFRKVKWIRRKRGLIGFFVFLSVIAFVLFFDYYWVLISRALKQPSQLVETTAGKFMKVSEKERRETFEETRKLLDAGQVEEARQLILKYLQKEGNAEGYYLAGLVYTRQGDVQSAYRNFKEAIRLKPDYYEAQQKLAEVYVTVGDLKSAQQTASILMKKGDYQEDGLLLQSEIALAEGNLEEALKKVQSAIDARKGDATEKSLIQLANLYARKGDRAKADQIIGRIDENKLDVTEMLSLSRYYVNTARNDRAATVMANALMRYPHSPEIQYFYGRQLFNQGQYREAVPYFQKVYKMMPQSHIASYRYGQALVASNQLEEANRHIENTLSHTPNDILALSLKVRYHLLKKENPEAVKALKQTIALVPEAPRPHTLLAELYWVDGILSVAESYAQKAIKLGERNISPRIILGDIYFRKGQYGKSLEQYGKILEREPTNLVALAHMADGNLNLGNVKKAEEFYEKIILNYPHVTLMKAKLELVRNMRKGPKETLDTTYRYYRQNPSSQQAVIGYVRSLIVNDRIDEAIAILNKAMKNNPKNVRYPMMIGEIHLAKKNIPLAKTYFEKALNIAPDDFNVLLGIGNAYENNSLDRDAEVIYYKIHKLYPQSIVVVNHLAWYYTERGDLEKAKPFIDTLRVKGEGAYEKDTIGWYLYKTKDYGSAEAYFRDALQSDPDNNAIRAHLALALFQANKNKEALTEAVKVAKFLPSGDLRNRITSLIEQQKRGAGK